MQPLKSAKAERLSDAELARSIVGGDMRAMEALMRRYNRSLFRTARAILRDDAEAEDAVQEAYLQAYQALGSFRGEARLSTWLVRITVNAALKRRPRGVRAVVVPLDGTAAVEVEAEMKEEARPDAEASRSEMRRLLERRIDALPDSFREVFVLRALEEFSVEETAEALDVPAATVRTRYFRARGLLRESLARDIDRSLEEAFGFAGARCDRMVAGVLGAIAALRA